MYELQEGQCGLCSHFAEHQPDQQEQVVQIRTQHAAPEDLVEECGHPEHEPLHLRVTALSGCDGFSPAYQTSHR
ncbi:MAG: hypothetical protein WD294_00735 [Phycisphaeraceae bacterium]